jgi:hypothetical protein
MWSDVAGWTALVLAALALARAEWHGYQLRRLREECEETAQDVDELCADSTTMMLREAGVDVTSLRQIPLPCPYCCSREWFPRTQVQGRWIHSQPGGRWAPCASQRVLPGFDRAVQPPS